MSVEVINAVRARRFGSALRKSVMYVLADYCDSDWSCFVGQRRLAAEAEVSERAVRGMLADMEAAGLLRREKRYGGRMGRTSDRITIIRKAVEGLPAARAANSDLPANDANLAANLTDLPANDDRPTGISFAAEPLENSQVEPSGRGACPDCESGQLIEKVGKLGRFLSCDRFPDCRYSEDLPRPTSEWKPSAADLEEVRRAHGDHAPPFLERVA